MRQPFENATNTAALANISQEASENRQNPIRKRFQFEPTAARNPRRCGPFERHREQDRKMPLPKPGPPATLIFDGDCGFCTTAILWLQRTLPRVPATAPFQWTDLAAFGLVEEQARSKVWFVSGGRRYGGAAAVAAVLRAQPHAGLRVLGWLATVPPWSWAAEAGYRVVARYRYRLPGGTPACRMPSAT
jgi:predicted DCC family thiol-disulfide oxidoreductase YuxK